MVHYVVSEEFEAKFPGAILASESVLSCDRDNTYNCKTNYTEIDCKHLQNFWEVLELMLVYHLWCHEVTDMIQDFRYLFSEIMWTK